MLAIATAPPTSSRTANLLAASRMFAGLDRDTLGHLARLATLRKLAAGERLWSAGERATHFTLISSGLFKIVRATPDGTAVIIALFGPHESIGDVAVLRGMSYPAAAIVLSASAEVLRVPAEPVITAMNARPGFACSMNRALIDHTQALQEKIRVMSAGAVPKRLATLLLGLAERFGDEGDDGAVEIPVALSRADLACFIGARVETTIRTIRAWERAGAVETTDSGFRLLQPEVLVRTTTSSDEA